MTILTSLRTDATIENETDSLGSGFRVLDSGLYDFEVELAYYETASSGAIGLNLHLKTSDGASLRQKLWLTSGTAKGCKNYYEKDGKKHYLPGFNTANALALLTVGKEIGDLEPEEGVIKLYSKDAGAEIPTKVQQIAALRGQMITAGVIKQITDKTQKNDATGEYVPTGETREENEIDKFFRHRDGLTVAEIRAQSTEAAFKASWDEKWTGQVKNRAKGLSANQAGVGTGLPAAANQAATPAKSLFG